MDAILNSSSQSKTKDHQMNCGATSPMLSYRPLNHELDEIRLVAVTLAQDASEPLRCSIKHVSLNHLPQYKALSYTWGAEFPCKSLIIDGVIVPVRENLEHALRRLRREAQGGQLLIWVDAICINQDDNAEKSEQISKMRSIFEHASMVVIWIGSETSNSPLAFKFIRDLTSCARADLSAMIKADQIKALRQLYYRDYWWRIWVVQEVVVARDAYIYCGDESIPWKVFEKMGDTLALVKDDLARLMYHDPDSVYKLLQLGPRSLKLPDLVADSKSSLLELLRSHRRKFSSDPRDKVFGLVGISSARDNFRIDYSWSTSKVYIYTAKYIIETSQNLDVICAKVPDGYSDYLPSWVPNWTRTDAHTKHRIMGLHVRTPAFQAGGNTKARAEFFEDDSVMTVEGIIIGTVLTLGMAVDLNKVPIQPVIGESIPKLRIACQAFQQWWNIFQKIKGDSITKQDVFERTVFGGSWSPVYELHQPHRLQLFSSLSKTILADFPEDNFELPNKTDFVAIGDIDNEKNQKAMVSAAGLRMHGKRLVICDSLHVGLAPWNCQEGDILCVLFGCNFPVILRPADEYFLLIGEVYVDNLMEGEAIARFREGYYALNTFKLR